MKADHWEQIGSLLAQALEKPQAERARFLEAACAADPALRAEVEALLGVEEGAEQFFDRLEGKAGAVVAARLEEQDQPEALGPYRLLREIGRGGMGRVFLAQHGEDPHGACLALKLLRADLDTPDFYARFLAERQILAALNHPNIASLVSGGVHEGERPYYVMEYVEGEPIDIYCDRHRQPLEKRLKLFIQVGEAVHHAHKRRVVHRDLKPSNVLVTAHGQAKLLDFGIAKLLESGPGQVRTRTGMRLMTLEYAAPEQIEGGPVSAATDIYQLGVVLYELLTGRPPYVVEGGGRYDLQRAVLEQVPERPSTAVAREVTMRRRQGRTRVTPAAVSLARRTQVGQLQRALRGDLDAIVLKALQKHPQRRYATAADLVEDVRRYLAGRRVAARRQALTDRLWQLLGRA